MSMLCMYACCADWRDDGDDGGGGGKHAADDGGDNDDDRDCHGGVLEVDP